MLNRHPSPPVLPKRWSPAVKTAILHVISLAQLAMAHTRGWAANSVNARMRLKADNDRQRQETALLREEIRIHRARMAQVPPSRRPHYPSTERMAILELKAARGWSLEQTAKVFLVTSATIASWLKRLDEQGPDALVQVPQPVNRFPDLVGHIVQRLKALCPTMGKAQIAMTLARAGLHLGATTVGRMLAQKHRPRLPTTGPAPNVKNRVVTAKYPNHVWHIDLTAVPTNLGHWCSWLPFALPQRWPFSWWVAVVVDHFSRRAMGCTAFQSQPNSEAVRSFLGRTIAIAEKTPKYIVCDRGSQFDCAGFRAWCRRKGIKPPRYGAIGKHGSLAVVEHFILTMKCLLASLPLVPYRPESFQHELGAIAQWYNHHRPHTWLRGRAPEEVYCDRYPANRKPRLEPRERWPRGSPCAGPWALVRGKPGAKVALEVRFHHGRKHLPIGTLLRVD
jgi:transposase InsO family protein